MKIWIKEIHLKWKIKKTCHLKKRLSKKRILIINFDQVLYKLDINGNGTLVEKEKLISITQFDSPDNFERFRW